MADRVSPGPVCGNASIREAVCVHTSKVYDACRAKECMQDLRVYPTKCSQQVLERAVSVKARCAELLWVNIDVEPVAFNRGFYTVDVKFFYKIVGEAYCGCGRPQEICGLATYDKRAILFGSEGGARIFSSRYVPGDPDIQSCEKSNMPQAVVETLDPIILEMKLLEPQCGCGCGCDCGCECSDVPECICRLFDDDIILGTQGKKLFVTLGQFSIIRLERDIQLLMPAYDVCMPDKECNCGGPGCCTEDPCSVFERFAFPVDEFFPPRREPDCGCGCTPACPAPSPCGPTPSCGPNHCGGNNSQNCKRPC